VGNAARRIDEMIARFSALRQAPAFQPSEMDLNRAVEDALAGIGQLPAVEVTRALRPIPAILADREQVQSVVTNLVLNARDAVADGGEIQVRTALEDGRVVVSVADNGCGMSHTFIRDSLFRRSRARRPRDLASACSSRAGSSRRTVDRCWLKANPAGARRFVSRFR
jgi:signal transduction histidine kinase